MNKLKILYHSSHIEFQEDVSIPGFLPMWETKLNAYTMLDISEEILNKLTEDEIDSITWFFFDLDNL